MAEQDVIYAWQAARHQFGPGKLHEVVGTPKEAAGDGEYKYPDELEKTRCGLRLDETPGHLVYNLTPDKVNCLGCRKKRRTDAEWAQQEKERAEKRTAFYRERAQRNAEWWAWYNDYLLSPEWRDRRRRVLERDDYLCQGCLIERATQVHHLTYERVGEEMCFDLVSICEECHDKIPRRDPRGPLGDF